MVAKGKTSAKTPTGSLVGGLQSTRRRAKIRTAVGLQNLIAAVPKQFHSALAGMPMEQLVHAVDTAATFVADASTEVQQRVTESIRAATSTVSRLPTPSLLAGTASETMQAILGDERLRQRVFDLEENVCVTVDPRTRSKTRLKSMRGRVYEVPLDDLRPDDIALVQTVDALKRAGFAILRVGRFGVRASGPARLIADVLGMPLAISAVPRIDGSRATRMFADTKLPPMPSDLFVAPRQSLSVDGSRLHAAINDFVFIPPPLLLAPTAGAPAVSFKHVDATALRKLLRVPGDGKYGALSGKGVKLAMIDSGFDVSHPYYAHNGFDFLAIDTRSAPDAAIDINGHGTAMAWNALAMAPGCELRGYKYTDPGAAFEDAADDGARIISCSWGYDREQSFPQIEASIRSVIEDDGCIVLFAAGNGQQCWPACMPTVIAVGGVYANPDTSALEASDFASGFGSNLYPGRNVPDISGLCGSSPSGIYFPLPVPAGSDMDRSTGGMAFPDKDETGVDDGWVYASGTSSATAQVAGLVALMLERASAKGKVLTAEQVRHLLQRSAQPVATGRNVFGFPAHGHPNIAVGWGLVDAGAALDQVDLLCEE
jgi:subtilisin family serine protease